MGGTQQYIPVIGTPVAFGIGFAVLVLVAFTGWLADSLVTVTHEGGHMLTFLMTGRGVDHFSLTDYPDRVEGVTYPADDKGPGIGDMIVRFSGYPAPSVVGLGGAYVIADGNAWGVLWVGIVLLAAALLVAKGTTALAVTGAALVGVGWAAVAGSPAVQAAVAVGLVWLLLIGGLRTTVAHSGGQDARDLAELYWIPWFVWYAIWLLIAVLSLWVGGRLLLGY